MEDEENEVIHCC